MVRAMKFGPNSDQVEDYLERVAGLEADDWAALALALQDGAGPSAATANALDVARSRATRHGVQDEVDTAVQNAHERLGTILDTSGGLRLLVARAVARVGPDDPDLAATIPGAGVAAIRTAATSGATLLVLRPLLDKHEFTAAWPVPIFDERSLPDHVSIPRIGATAF